MFNTSYNDNQEFDKTVTTKPVTIRSLKCVSGKGKQYKYIPFNIILPVTAFFKPYTIYRYKYNIDMLHTCERYVCDAS